MCRRWCVSLHCVYSRSLMLIQNYLFFNVGSAHWGCANTLSMLYVVCIACSGLKASTRGCAGDDNKIRMRVRHLLNAAIGESNNECQWWEDQWSGARNHETYVVRSVISLAKEDLDHGAIPNDARKRWSMCSIQLLSFERHLFFKVLKFFCLLSYMPKTS